jgi:hypothetical protein
VNDDVHLLGAEANGKGTPDTSAGARYQRNSTAQLHSALVTCMALPIARDVSSR